MYSHLSDLELGEKLFDIAMTVKNSRKIKRIKRRELDKEFLTLEREYRYRGIYNELNSVDISSYLKEESEILKMFKLEGVDVCSPRYKLYNIKMTEIENKLKPHKMVDAIILHKRNISDNYIYDHSISKFRLNISYDVFILYAKTFMISLAVILSLNTALLIYLIHLFKK